MFTYSGLRRLMFWCCFHVMFPSVSCRIKALNEKRLWAKIKELEIAFRTRFNVLPSFHSCLYNSLKTRKLYSTRRECKSLRFVNFSEMLVDLAKMKAQSPLALTKGLIQLGNSVIRSNILAVYHLFYILQFLFAV